MDAAAGADGGLAVTAAVLVLALTGCVLAAGVAVLAAGVRAGDRHGETIVSMVEIDRAEGVLRFSLDNPGDQAVLVGATVRRRSARMRLEAGHYVQVPRRTARRSLMAEGHAVIGAIDALETEIVSVPLPAALPQRAELVVAVGEADRLRVLHRAVEFLESPRAAAGNRRAAVVAQLSGPG